jgi:small GTP-binding protein
MTLDYDLLIKIILVGDSQVGKSSLLLRYSDNYYDTNSLATIGLDLRLKTEEINGKIAKIQLWDTAGQERFKTVTQGFYRGAHGIMIVYDVTDMTSFENVNRWYEDIHTKTQGSCVVFLVGNKVDNHEKRLISMEEGEALANKHGMVYFETSAKSSQGVQSVFRNLLTTLVDRKIFISNRSSLTKESDQRIKELKKPPKDRGCPIWPF